MHNNDKEIRLEEIKKNVLISHKYWQENYDRYHVMRRFVYYSTLSKNDEVKLMSLKKPIIEGNILEAFLSRMIASFINNEPSISVKKDESVPGIDLINERQAEFLESHLRAKLGDSENDDFKRGVFEQTTSGGFGWGEVYVDYPHERSWEYEIGVTKCPDPTLCGSDPTAEKPHKGDGEYVYKLTPFTKDRFIEVYGKDTARDIKFISSSSATFADFEWAYYMGDIEIVLIAEYYWKKRKRERLFQLSNGMSVTRTEYDKLAKLFEESNRIEQFPIIVRERMEEFTTIMRDVVCQTKILESEETQFSMFPLIFCDGNSQHIKDAEGAGIKQVTRPCFYQSVGAQKLKDFAMQTSAAEIENMVQSKLMTPIEGLPQDENYLKAYTNFQQASTLVYNAFDLDNPEKALPPPREIQRTPTPTIVMETFVSCDNLIQQTLGSYDLQPFLSRDTSGESIKQSALQTAQANEIYHDNFNIFLQRVAEVLLDIFPKYYDTPRTVPIKGLDGKRGYQVINDQNDPESININYEPSALKIKVEAGPSVNAQKQMALKQLTSMAQVLPSFGRFLDEEGGEIIINNMDLDGGDTLKVMYDQWKEKNKQQQEQQSQMQQQSQMAMQQALIQKEQSAAMKNQADAQSTIKKVQDAESQFVANLLLDEQKAQEERAIDVAKVAIEKQKVDIDTLKIQMEMQQTQINTFIRIAEVDAENARTAVESAISLDRHHHDKQVDIANLNTNNP